jgi:hypothetical protein
MAKYYFTPRCDLHLIPDPNLDGKVRLALFVLVPLPELSYHFPQYLFHYQPSISPPFTSKMSSLEYDADADTISTVSAQTSFDLSEDEASEAG